MRDREIVALLVSGDRADVRRGLEAAYTTYADRLHDYARSMLRAQDPTAAADVLQDTFLIAAAKAPDLRDPERFRPWLYAITRNECLRVMRAGKRHDPLEYDDGTPHPALVAADAERSPDMASDLDRNDLRDLVHAAAAGLSTKDHEVFDLGMRHDLSAPEIAKALRVSENTAHAMLSRVRAQFTRSLGALSVARHGRDACTSLDTMLSGWDGTFDALWRKRIARHVEGCAVCSTTQEHELSPSALLGIIPLLGAPAVVRDRLFGDDLDLVSADLLAAGRALLHRAGPFDREGFPGEVATRRRPAALALLGVFQLLGGLLALGWFTRDARLQRDAQALPTTQINSDLLNTTTSASVPLPGFTVAPGGTLTPVPVVSVSPSSTPTLSATVVPTTSAPTRTHSSAPTTPTSAPTSTPPAVGTLTVTPPDLLLSRGQSGTVTLTASGGPVHWTSSRGTDATSYLQMSATSGTLADGETQVVTITLRSSTPNTVTSMTIRFGPGAHTVTVNVLSPG
jgi:RNA polymerase sigma factor (sigma-70 family)